jgi:hypothetical protein
MIWGGGNGNDIKQSEIAQMTANPWVQKHIQNDKNMYVVQEFRLYKMSRLDDGD